MPDKYQNFNPSKLKALKGTIITRQIQNPTVLESGLVLSYNRERYSGEHRVLAVGEDIDDIKPGYIVVLNKGRGHLFEADDEFHNTIKYNQVLGVVQTPEDEKPYFRPVRDQILIKLNKGSEVIGSIYVPETARRNSSTAKVLALGSYSYIKKDKKVPFNIQIGDEVYVRSNGATPITIFGDECYLVTEDNIVGRYEEII